jgi:type II secretion system protein D
MNQTISRLLFNRPSASGLRWLCVPAVLWWAATASAQTDAANQPAMQVLRLASMPAEKLEIVLHDLLGERLKPMQNVGGPRVSWLFVPASGRQVELIFDRQQNEVTLRGPAGLVEQLRRLIVTVDSSPGTSDGDRVTRVIRLRRANPGQVLRMIEAYRSGQRDGQPPPPSNAVPRPRDTSRLDSPLGSLSLAGALFAGRASNVVFRCQSPDAGAAPPAGAAMPPPGAQRLPTTQRPDERGPVSPVRPRFPSLDSDLEVETLPDLDALILRGRPREVEELRRIIEEIERLSAETQPEIDVVYLTHVSCEALATIVKQVDPELTGGRQGRATAVALVKPNALLLIGWGEAVKSIKELVRKLDLPVAPETQFRVFRLRHAVAATAQTTIQNLFTKQTGLGPQVKVTADIRTNSLIVQAAPRDLEEVDQLVQRLDQAQGEAVRQVHVFQLKNSLAVDVASVLQGAIGAAKTGSATQKNAALELLSVDAKGQKLLRAGLLDDVQITPDPRTNALIVAGPAESMELLEALVKQLDTPSAVAQIKVFRIVNGDATSMVQMLHMLLFSRTTNAGAMPSAPLAGAENETTLVPVRFSVDLRTNSIIATGSQSDLAIIEALLLRLDEDKGTPRKNAVYQLKNNPATDIARSINEFLRSEKQVQQTTPGVVNPFQQIESEVVVVPEVVSNSLIVSATPRFYDDVMDLVKKLDAERPQVVIQVLIAQVMLSNQDEFGIELGLQDSILFDRSLLGNLVSTTSSSQTSTPSGIVTQTQQNILGASNQPGYAFNNAPLGNSGGAQALANPSQVGTQGLSSFGVGRTNNTLGYGGLVLSASSESVSVLIRALQQTSRMEVLSRPQIMTLDNQPAFVQVGQRVPRITGSTLTQVGQQNNIVLENVGLILGVTPRISPDGRVVMEVDAEKSQLGNIADGIPVTTSGGVVINSPTIDLATAQTTVSAIDGETIIIGGLITKSTQTINRRVPYLSDIPLLGLLFRYDSHDKERNEMLIILTPHIVRGPEDAERVRHMEESRMNWCLCDVNQIHGPVGFGLKNEPQTAPVVFPDANPRGTLVPIPQPAGQPPLQESRPETVPPGAQVPPANTSAPAAAPAPGTAMQRLPTTDAAQLTNYQPSPREPFAVETCRGNTVAPPAEERRWLQ